MFFSKQPKIPQEQYGVVCVDTHFVVGILSLKTNKILRPSHGIREIDVHSILFDQEMKCLVALVSSPDIPDYVSYKRIMECLEVYTINNVKYPVLTLHFEAVTPMVFYPNNDENVGFDEYFGGVDVEEC